MSTQVTQAKTLQERITEKLHDQIGELITSDDLKAMVEVGIKKALFDKREWSRRDSSGYMNVTHQNSLVDELVSKFLEEKMKEAVENWIKANPDEMKAIIEKTVQLGAGGAMMKVLDFRFAEIFNQGVQQMQYQGLLPKP